MSSRGTESSDSKIKSKNKLNYDLAGGRADWSSSVEQKTATHS